MSSDPTGSGSSSYVRPSANDRFKRGWSRSVVGATLLGVVFHIVLLYGTPQMEVKTTAGDRTAPAQLLRLVNLPAFSLPRAPEVVIIAPALPTVDELNLDLQPEIEVPVFLESPLTEEGIRPPIRRAQDQWLDYRKFAPYVVRPELRNRGELVRFLQRSYQPIYEFTGATGVVQVTFWIDEGGMVEKAEIVKSSGSRSLDRLALRLSRVLRFRPAMMAGRPIRILVHMPITFRAA